MVGSSKKYFKKIKCQFVTRLLLRNITFTYFKVKKSRQINLNIFYYFFPSLKWVYINIRKVRSSKKYFKKIKSQFGTSLLLRSGIFTYFKVKKSNHLNLNIFYYYFPSLKCVYINILTVGSSKKYFKKIKYQFGTSLLLRSGIFTYFKVKKSNHLNLNIFYYYFPSLKCVYINIRTVGSSKKYFKKIKYQFGTSLLLRSGIFT